MKLNTIHYTALPYRVKSQVVLSGLYLDRRRFLRLDEDLAAGVEAGN